MKELIILCTSEGLPTARLLLTALNRDDVALMYPIPTTRKGSWRVNEMRDGVIVKTTVVNPIPAKRWLRWGNRMSLTPSPEIQYNTVEALNLSAHKLRARKTMIASTVPCPSLVTPADANITYPVICRPHQHKAGQNFGVLRDYGTFKHQFNKLQATHYFSAFIDKDREFRVHCAHGKILSVSEKPRPADPSVIAWNHAVNADAFTVINWTNYDINMIRAALDAVRVLGLHFGAVDIIMKDGVSYILEVNSAPSLLTTEYMTLKYVRYINWLLMSSEVRKPFDYKEYKNIKSFPWKDFNFEDRAPIAKHSSRRG